MAREFTHMIHEKYPEARIRFLGIFDTVAQVGAPDDANRNSGIRLRLPVDVIGFTAHAVAKGEKRSLFPMTSIAGSYAINAYGGKQWGVRLKPLLGITAWRVPKKYGSSDYMKLKGEHYWEQPFEGAHSDIGGGYGNGTNLRALRWMYKTGRSKGVPFDSSSRAFQKRKGAYKMVPKSADGIYQWHDSRYKGVDKVPFSSRGRTTRRIYNGGM